MVWTRTAWGARNRHSDRVRPSVRRQFGAASLVVACLILAPTLATLPAANAAALSQTGTTLAAPALFAASLSETTADNPVAPAVQTETRPGIGAPLVKDRNVRLTAAPLTTGVAPGIAILPPGFAASAAVTATVQASETPAKPLAPTLKEDAVARNAAAPARSQETAASDTATNPETGTTTQSTTGDANPESVDAARDAATTTSTPTGTVGAQENPADTPGDFIPPYTDNLDAVSNEPLFSPPQTVAWIIALIALALFVALFGWFVRRLVTNALEAEEPTGESIFQTTSDQMYRFDDDDHMAATTVRPADTERDDDLHRPLNGADYDPHMEEEDTLFGDDVVADARADDSDTPFGDVDDEDETPEKRGLMSWLFNRRKQKADDDFDPLDNDEERAFIDVDVNPPDPEDGDEMAVVHIHRADETPEDTPDADLDQDGRGDDAPAPEPAPVVAAEPMVEPSVTPAVPQPKPARPPATTPLNASMFAADQDEKAAMDAKETAVERAAQTAGDNDAANRSYLFIDAEKTRPVPKPVSSSASGRAPQPVASAAPTPPPEARETEQMLQRLEKRQQETGEAISDLRQKYTAQAQKLTTELGNFRAQTNSFQQSTNQTLEKRFAAISTTLEQGLAETRRLTDEKINHVSKQATEMNTEDLEKKLQHLDERFTSQARLTDMNFGKVIQKLDGAAATKPNPASQDIALLRAMQVSLDESKSMLSNFQSETQLTARNVAHMGDRMASLEAELSEQRQMVNTLIDEVAAGRQDKIDENLAVPAAQPKMDALGLFAPASPPVNAASELQSERLTARADNIPAKPGSAETVSTWAPASETAPSATNRSVITVDLDDPAPFRETRLPAGTTSARAAQPNGHDANSQPVAAQPQDAQPRDTEQHAAEDPDITPILIEPASVTRQPAAPARAAQDGPLSFSTSEATGAQTAVQTPSAPAAPKPLRIPTEERAAGPEKTIRPLTFGFTSYDKNATNR
ncbi:MAG: hypothetical protein AAFO78_06425 [Pseudomonadota bacterium]